MQFYSLGGVQVDGLLYGGVLGFQAFCVFSLFHTARFPVKTVKTVLAKRRFPSFSFRPLMAVRGVLFLSLFLLGMGQAATAEPLVFAASKTGWLAWLAEEKGFFKEVGVDVKMVEVSSGVDAAAGLTDGRFHIATMSEFAFASLIFSHPNTQVFGTVAALRNVFLIGRKDRGIEMPIDLKGKTIGLREKSISEFLLGRILDLHGLSISDIKIVNVAAPDLAQALKDGRVDAIVSWQPYADYAIDAVGGEKFEMTVQGRQPYYFTLVGDGVLLRKRDEDIQKILKALIEASEWALENSIEAKAILSRKTGLELKLVEKLAKDHVMDVSLQQDMLVLMEDETIWRVERGLSQPPLPNVLAHFYLSPLSKVDPTRITVIH